MLLLAQDGFFSAMVSPSPSPAHEEEETEAFGLFLLSDSSFMSVLIEIKGQNKAEEVRVPSSESQGCHVSFCTCFNILT